MIELLEGVLQELKELKEKSSTAPVTVYVYPSTTQTYPNYPYYPQVTWTGTGGTTYGAGGGWSQSDGGDNTGGVTSKISWIGPTVSSGGAALTPEQVSETKELIDDAFAQLAKQVRQA
jgi:hypothetical protein